MAEEQKYIGHWYRDGWSRDRILQEVMACGIGRARKKLRFKGILEHQEPLMVVGDKCGWDAVSEYRNRGATQDILTQFSAHMEMPVKTIVSLRHPLDNISTWVLSPKYKRIYADDNVRFRRMIRRYRRFHDAAEQLIEGQDVFYLYNEDLIANPNQTIQDLSDWLGLPPKRGWRRASALRVFSEPRQRRHQLNWPKQYERRVVDYINTSPLLERYRETE